MRWMLGALLFGALVLAQFSPGPLPPGPNPLPAQPQKGQAPPAPPNPAPGGALPLPAPSRAYPLPAWIHPGVAFIYSAPGIGLTNVYLVTDVAGTRAYGLSITLMQFSGASPMAQITAQVLIQNGAGLFYVNPQAAADYLRLAKAHPQPGVQVSGGPGILAIEYQSQNGKTSVALRYDPQTGIVTEATTSSTFPTQEGPKTQAAALRYVGYQTFTRQSPPDFPPAARESHAYQILATPAVPGGAGMTMPSGQINIRPMQLAKPLAQFQVQVQMQGYPMTQTLGGLTALGPHYLHPALLSRQAIFALPKLGLSLTVSGDTVTLAWGQMPLVTSRIQPQTGLLLEQTQTDPMGQITYRLLR